MTVTAAQDARELVRFLLSSAGHPVVLDRDDCALLADRIELARVLEEKVQGCEINVPGQAFVVLTN